MYPGSILICSILFWVQTCNGHARMLEPPSRASMWRRGYDTPKDFNDNEGHCGGLLHHYIAMEGKCGICGDPWDGPRNHEAPDGIFATGKVVRTYASSENISAEIEITANHGGYFVFKLCNNGKSKAPPKQECFDRNILAIFPTQKTKYIVKNDCLGIQSLNLKLPKNIHCKHCILQWTYMGGNNWGTCSNGTTKKGCGPQEIFRACADISIRADKVYDSPSYLGSLGHLFQIWFGVKLDGEI